METKEFIDKIENLYKSVNGKGIKGKAKTLKDRLIKMYLDENYYLKILEKDKWLYETLNGELGYALAVAVKAEDKLEYLVRCKDEDYRQKHNLMNAEECDNKVALTLVGENVFMNAIQQYKMS
ncbi:MAG: hypothetical protein RSE41_02830 [Clostridia bacterium]